MNLPIEKITWRDISAEGRWMNLDECKAWGIKAMNADFVTIGYLIFENDDFVLSAATYDTTDPDHLSYNDVSMIQVSH
jgi:hypothetical protein